MVRWSEPRYLFSLHLAAMTTCLRQLPSLKLLRRFPPHQKLVHQRGLLNQLPEGRGRLDFFLVGDDEVHTNVLEAVGSMSLCGHHDLHYVINRYGLADSVLAERLKAVKKK